MKLVSTRVAVLLLGVSGCAPVVRPHPPVLVACTTDRIGAVHVTGAPRAAVASLTVLEGTLHDAGRTDRIAEGAVQSLRWLGYEGADIQVTQTEGCFTDLEVAVELGPKYSIAAIDFDTDDEFPSAERYATIQDELGRVNSVGGVHIDYRLRRALADLEQRYHDAGWLDAVVSPPQTDYDEDHGVVSIRVAIDAGNRYRVGEIRAVGGSASLRDRILDDLGVEEGAWYDGPTIRRGIARARKSSDRHIELKQAITGDDDVIEIDAIVAPRDTTAVDPPPERHRTDEAGLQ